VSSAHVQQYVGGLRSTGHETTSISEEPQHWIDPPVAEWPHTPKITAFVMSVARVKAFLEGFHTGFRCPCAGHSEAEKGFDLSESRPEFPSQTGLSDTGKLGG